MYRKNAIIVVIFCLLAILLRFFSFFPSVIDHDESTYLEIARMLIHGKTLYVDMVDIKPPGIFLILAGLQFVFGYPIFVIRMLVSVWIGITAFLIFLTGKAMMNDDRPAIASGIIYIFFISTWSFYGISITPEIFFNLFTIAALLVIVKKKHVSKYLWAGLLAGIGFIVKYLVIFDFAVIVLFFIITEYRKNETKKFQKAFLSIIMAGFGFTLPFAVMNLWYVLNGHFNDLYNIVYLSPSRYPAAFDAWKMLKYILDFHLRFFPFFLLFYFVILKKYRGNNAISTVKTLSVLWSGAALIAVVLAGKTFGHYTIQLMLPVSLTAGIFFHPDMNLTPRLAWLTDRRTGMILLALLVLAVTMMKLEYVFRKDVPREVAAYLEPRLRKNDVIYTGNYHHIIYYLLGKDSPTKYVHRTLLTGENHIKALDIDVDKEFGHIMDQRPAYILVYKDYGEGMMKDFIRKNYFLEKVFDNEVFLYRRKGI